MRLKKLWRPGATGAWRQRLTLTAAVTWAVSIAILGAGGSAGYYAFSVIYSNKLIDTWAIMYFELEQEGSRLAEKLRQVAGPNAEAESSSDLLFNRVNTPEHTGLPQRGSAKQSPSAAASGAENYTWTPVGGAASQPISAADLGLGVDQLNSNLPALTLVDLAGETFAVSWPGATQLLLRKVAPRFFAAEMPKRAGDEAVTYLLTTEGKLLYANDPEVKPETFVDRPLVQKFIASPLTQGQLDFRTSSGAAAYGFFREIPDSNLVMFAEVLRDQALASLKAVVWRFVGVLAAILTVAVVLLQLPLVRLTRPIKELAQLTQRIGRGDFNVAAREQGFGEVAVLTGAFNTMARDILERDKAIHRLMAEQTEKVRLEAELKIARDIQTNLLPSVKLPRACGLDIGSSYIPATECAGDWYSYHFDPTSGATVIALADVSGHGTGSSMFTAIIAGLFDQFITSTQGDRSLADFAQHVNGVIYRLGKSQWHATMLLARYEPNTAMLELIFAGHPSPLLIRADKPVDSLPTRLVGPSMVLGLGDSVQLTTVATPFPAGSRLLMYTDGLTEARGPDGRAFGNKRLTQAFHATRKLNTAAATAQVIGTWRDHRGTRAADDDTCVLVLAAL